MDQVFKQMCVVLLGVGLATLVGCDQEDSTLDSSSVPGNNVDGLRDAPGGGNPYIPATQTSDSAGASTQIGTLDNAGNALTPGTSTTGGEPAPGEPSAVRLGTGPPTTQSTQP